MSVLAGTGSESGHCWQFTAAMELLLPVPPMCSTAPALPQIQQDDVKCLSQDRRGRDPSSTAQLSTAALGHRGGRAAKICRPGERLLLSPGHL